MKALREILGDSNSIHYSFPEEVVAKEKSPEKPKQTPNVIEIVETQTPTKKATMTRPKRGQRNDTRNQKNETKKNKPKTTKQTNKTRKVSRSKQKEQVEVSKVSEQVKVSEEPRKSLETLVEPKNDEIFFPNLMSGAPILRGDSIFSGLFEKSNDGMEEKKRKIEKEGSFLMADNNSLDILFADVKRRKVETQSDKFFKLEGENSFGFSNLLNNTNGTNLLLDNNSIGLLNSGNSNSPNKIVLPSEDSFLNFN